MWLEIFRDTLHFVPLYNSLPADYRVIASRRIPIPAAMPPAACKAQQPAHRDAILAILN